MPEENIPLAPQPYNREQEKNLYRRQHDLGFLTCNGNYFLILSQKLFYVKTICRQKKPFH